MLFASRQPRAQGFNRLQEANPRGATRGVPSVCSQQQAWEAHCLSLGSLFSCSPHASLHVHTGRPEHVHRQRCNETIPQVQAR